MTQRSLKLVFMGNPEFAVPALQKIDDSRHNINVVVTGTDKRRGRGGQTSVSAVKSEALKRKLPVLGCDHPEKERLAAQIESYQPDLLVVVAYKMLPASVLAIPKIGAINLHASLLPKYRGAAPIHHALLNGETKTGCTVFLLDEGMDTGKIIAQKETAIGLLETTGEVYERLRYSGAELLVEAINNLADKTCTWHDQVKEPHSLAPRLHPKNAEIDFNKEYMDVHNLIRAMSPFPGAWFYHDEKKIKVYRSAPDGDIMLSAGKGKIYDGKAYIGCGQGSVELIEVQPEGKKKVDGVSFINGYGGEISLL